MIRTVHAVGQGTFITERFGNQVVIYDCGTSSSIDIEKTIRLALYDDPIIEMLFISHFHEDHISGIEYLLKNYQVNKVFVPLLDPLEIALYRQYYSRVGLFSSSFTRLFFSDNASSFNESFNTQLIFVEPMNEEESQPINNDESFVEYESISTDMEIWKPWQSIVFRGGRGIVQTDWVYVTHCYQRSSRLSTLLSVISRRGVSPEHLTNNLQNAIVRKTIISIYKEVNKDLNANCMVLFSGPRGLPNMYYNVQLNPYAYVHQKAGALYTGDYCMGRRRYQSFENRFKQYFESIYLMQVPHHGANNSGHQRLMDLAYKYFICAGGSNQYQHPHKFVTDSLLKEMIDFQVVTERKYSELVYEIYPL